MVCLIHIVIHMYSVFPDLAASEYTCCERLLNLHSKMFKSN